MPVDSGRGDAVDRRCRGVRLAHHPGNVLGDGYRRVIAGGGDHASGAGTTLEGKTMRVWNIIMRKNGV